MINFIFINENSKTENISKLLQKGGYRLADFKLVVAEFLNQLGNHRRVFQAFLLRDARHGWLGGEGAAGGAGRRCRDDKQRDRENIAATGVRRNLFRVEID